MCIFGDIGLILGRDLLRFYRIGNGRGMGEWASFCRNLLGLWDVWEIGWRYVKDVNFGKNCAVAKISFE